MYCSPRDSGSSPHTRGAHRRGGAVGDGMRIIPAYAGSTRAPLLREAAHQDHPRIRGEHSKFRGVSFHFVGSSPHTRGALPIGDWNSVTGGIIPAYAGSTVISLTLPRRRADHPRIRGEHALDPAARSGGRGSSPHTRGALRLHRRHRARRGIIPAYAGSTATTPTT